MTRLKYALCCAFVIAFGGTAQADSQSLNTSVTKLTGDLGIVGVNTPVWLAQHLPAMMNQSGLGAGIELADKSGGISFGIIPLHLGVMNQFNQVGQGTEVLRFDKTLPAVLPWPQVGVTLGIGLGNGLELGADARFMPKTDFALNDQIGVEVGVLSASTTLRWRINSAKGGMPAFVIGIGGAYSKGTMDIGAGFQNAYSISTSQGTIEGTYLFEGSPRMSWEIFQISGELRVGWKLGAFRPYLGFGFGYSFGEVAGATSLKARVTVDKVGGQAVSEAPKVEEYQDEYFVTTPAKFTLRPMFGLDFVFGIFDITLQAELALMTQEQLSLSDVDSAVRDLVSSNGDSLFDQASRQATVSAALVTTLAMRLQF